MACGIFLDQGSNLCLLHWQVDALPGKPQFSLCFILKVEILEGGHVSSLCDASVPLNNQLLLGE